MVHGVNYTKQNFHGPSIITVMALLVILLTFRICHAQRDCVVQTYRAEVGVRESTGNNDGYHVEKYLASTQLGAGYAWCAAFVNWNFKQCSIATPQGAAWSPTWFTTPSKIVYARNTKNNTTPQPGDVFGLYYTSKKRIAHVGFVDEWGKRVRTVEGNTNQAGSREGDGVYIKYRLADQIYVVANWIDL